jgi:Cas10/Cmr2, second palm domain
MTDIAGKRQTLVIIETQKVKSYLFASPYMRETRGGSLLLDLLNRKITREVLATLRTTDYEENYLGGGSGRILFGNRDDADEFKRRLLDHYRRDTADAAVSVELIDRRADECFQDWVHRGVGESRNNKLGKRGGISLIGGRWSRPCSSCGRGSAERLVFEHGRHYLCRSCSLKRSKVNQLYSNTKPTPRKYRRLKSVQALSEHYDSKFIFTTLAREGERRKTPLLLPQDFEDIGAASRPGNYMGFIYADGDRMGETVKRLGKLFLKEEDLKQAYRAFSEIVDEATRTAAVDAVMTVVGTRRGGELPAEFILAGGDDLMLAVPAHLAIDTAILFMEKYTEQTKSLQAKYIGEAHLKDYFATEGLTTSAGIVIAHAHFPVSDLMSLAGQLMNSAKKKSALVSARGQADNKGCLDFMIVADSVSEPLQKRREKEYEKKEEGISLTERPYTTDEARKLLERIRGMKADLVPRTKLKALYSALFHNGMQAQFEALRIVDRLNATGNFKPGSTIHQLFNDFERFPFRGGGGHWTTPLADIIELYDYIHPEERPPQKQSSGGE